LNGERKPVQSRKFCQWKLITGHWSRSLGLWIKALWSLQYRTVGLYVGLTYTVTLNVGLTCSVVSTVEITCTAISNVRLTYVMSNVGITLYYNFKRWNKLCCNVKCWNNLKL
jgi:hypothetical protein